MQSIRQNTLQNNILKFNLLFIQFYNPWFVFQPIEYSRLKQQWEIARKDIRLVDLVAKGTFVEVWQGRMRKYPRRNDIMKVAIKRIVCKILN